MMNKEPTTLTAQCMTVLAEMCRVVWKLQRTSALQTKQCTFHGGPGMNAFSVHKDVLL